MAGAPSTKPPPEDDDAEDRATLVPEFNPEEFARDSEIRMRAVEGAGGTPTIDQARILHGQGEHEKALFLLTRLLDLSPLHHEANKLAKDCRAALELDCLAALGAEDAVLVIAVGPDHLKTLELDNVSGYLLSLLDGMTSVGNVLDIITLPRLLALRHLRALKDRGIVREL